jgi:hypothetical protein
VGLLRKNSFEHPWVETATAFCWTALEGDLDELGPDDAISVLRFLEHAEDRGRVDTAFERLGERIMNELVALDPATPGYVKTPLELAPRPKALARRLFDERRSSSISTPWSPSRTRTAAGRSLGSRRARPRSTSGAAS